MGFLFSGTHCIVMFINFSHVFMGFSNNLFLFHYESKRFLKPKIKTGFD